MIVKIEAKKDIYVKDKDNRDKLVKANPDKDTYYDTEHDRFLNEAETRAYLEELDMLENVDNEEMSEDDELDDEIAEIEAEKERIRKEKEEQAELEKQKLEELGLQENDLNKSFIDYSTGKYAEHDKENEEEIAIKKEHTEYEKTMAEINSPLQGMMDDIAKAFDLDKTKAFVTQNVDKKMFQNGLTYLFDTYMIGRKKIEGMNALRFNEMIKTCAVNAGLYLFFATDKDRHAYVNKKEHEQFRKNKEAYHKKLVKNVDKMDKEELFVRLYGNLTTYKELGLKENGIEAQGSYIRNLAMGLRVTLQDSEEYVEGLREQYIKKMMIESFGVEYEYTENFNFSEQFVRPDVDENRERDFSDIEKAVERMQYMQAGMMKALLNGGNPNGAYHQFLDQEALKKGEYQFDEKKITDFVNNNFLTKKQMEKEIASRMRASDFKVIIDDIKKRHEIEEEQVDFNDEGATIFNKYKRLHQKDPMFKEDNNMKAKAVDEYTKYHLRKKITVKNEEMIELACLYKQMSYIKEMKGKWFWLFHPFKNRELNNMQESLKTKILGNLVEGTELKTKMMDYLNNPYAGKMNESKINELENIAKEINDDKKFSPYQEKFKDLFVLENVPEELGKDAIIKLEKEEKLAKEEQNKDLSKVVEKTIEKSKEMNELGK